MIDLGTISVTVTHPIAAQLLTGTPVDLGLITGAVTVSDDFGSANDFRGRCHSARACSLIDPATAQSRTDLDELGDSRHKEVAADESATRPR